MAFGNSGYGHRFVDPRPQEDVRDPAGGLKAFAGSRGAPAPIQNSEEKQFADKMAGAVVDTALKNSSGQLLGSGAGEAAVKLGATNLGTLGTALKGVGASAMGGGAGMGAALGSVGSAMLPFAGPLALAALPFMLKGGDVDVANDDDMDSEEISAINKAYKQGIWDTKMNRIEEADATSMDNLPTPPGIARQTISQYRNIVPNAWYNPFSWLPPFQATNAIVDAADAGMNIWGLKRGTHKVAGIDPQKYNSGTGGAKNPPGIRTILGVNPMSNAAMVAKTTSPTLTPAQVMGMGASGIKSTASSAPPNAMSIHDAFRPAPGSAPSNYNPFANTVEAGRQVQKNIKANEIRSMLNSLQNADLKDNLSTRTGAGMLSKLFRGGPLGAAISTAVAPTMAADATWSDEQWNNMMQNPDLKDNLSTLKPPLSDRAMKQELHDQKLRQNDEMHRAKMMAQ